MSDIDAKLAAALHEAGLPEHAKRAAEGWFNEHGGRFPDPVGTLLHDLVVYDKHELAQRVRNGEFGSMEPKLFDDTEVFSPSITLTPPKTNE